MYIGSVASLINPTNMIARDVTKKGSHHHQPQSLPFWHLVYLLSTDQCVISFLSECLVCSPIITSLVSFLPGCLVRFYQNNQSLVSFLTLALDVWCK